jgi:hypothetical protein
LVARVEMEEHSHLVGNPINIFGVITQICPYRKKESTKLAEIL